MINIVRPVKRPTRLPFASAVEALNIESSSPVDAASRIAAYFMSKYMDDYGLPDLQCIPPAQSKRYYDLERDVCSVLQPAFDSWSQVVIVTCLSDTVFIVTPHEERVVIG